MGDGQVTVTDVIVDDPLPPPPQAAISVRLASTNTSPSFCTIVSPLADIAGLNALRHELWNVGLTVEAAHVSALREHDAWRFDHDRTAAPAGRLFAGLLCGGLLDLLVVRAEQLLEVGGELAFPSDAENRSSRRDELSHGTCRRGDFMHDIGAIVHAAQRALHQI